MLDHRCQSEPSRLYQPEPQESARRAREANGGWRPLGRAHRRRLGRLDPLASGCFSPKPILQGLQEVSDMQTHTLWINGCWRSLLRIIPRVLLAVLKCYRSSCQRLRSGLQGRPRPQEYPASSLLFRHSCAVIFPLTRYFSKARVHPKVKFTSLASP